MHYGTSALRQGSAQERSNDWQEQADGSSWHRASPTEPTAYSNRPDQRSGTMTLGTGAMPRRSLALMVTRTTVWR